MSASPFSFGLGPMTDEIAGRLRRGPLGIANAFSGAPDIAWPSEAGGPGAAQPAPETAAQPQGPGPVAGLARVPLPPARPVELAPPSQADLPAEYAQPIMATPQAGLASTPAGAAAREEPGFMDRLMGGIQKSDGLLTSLGLGLMTQRGLPSAVAAGLQHHQTAQKNKAVTDLAKAEYGLKALKVQQETGALKGNASLLKRAFPEMTDEQALGGASNSAMVTEAIKRIQNPNHGRERVADSSGVQRWVDSGQPVFEGDQGKADVQLLQRPDGSVMAVDKAQIGAGGGVTQIAPSANKLPVEMAEREQALVSRGMDPKDPRNEDYILTGKRPREDQQKLTAGDKKVINEAEDEELALGQTIDTLKRARELNRKTFTGVTAGARGWLGTALPDGLVPDFIADPQGAADTREFGQIMSMEAIKSMSQTLKGATTDREMARFMEILGDPTTPPDIRERTIDRMHTLAIRQRQLAQSRMRDLREGDYYKPRGAAAAAPQPDAPALPQQSAAPAKRLRFDPTTGGLN